MVLVRRVSLVSVDVRGRPGDVVRGSGPGRVAGGDRLRVCAPLPAGKTYPAFTQVSVTFSHMGLYAFVTMLLYGMIEHVVPRLLAREWRYASLIKRLFWASAYGIGMMSLMHLYRA